MRMSHISDLHAIPGKFLFLFSGIKSLAIMKFEQNKNQNNFISFIQDF